jgi:hypothetical protein
MFQQLVLDELLVFDKFWILIFWFDEFEFVHAGARLLFHNIFKQNSYFHHHHLPNIFKQNSYLQIKFTGNYYEWKNPKEKSWKYLSNLSGKFFAWSLSYEFLWSNLFCI